MLNLDNLQHHPLSEKVVNTLCIQTQRENTLFFRVLVAYYFSLVASSMRCTIVTHDRGEIPVNMFALNLGTSGSGKGHSTNIMKSSVVKLFRERFVDDTFIAAADIHMPKLALKRANRKSTDPDDELARLQAEFEAVGKLAFTFDKATQPAIKQQRHKLLLADAGSLNLQIDEIGLNLSGSIEALAPYLELYDVGEIDANLIKNSADNKRVEEIIGRTPTNLMMFGTPSKLLDGGKTEADLYDLLDTGYARRCFFGYTRESLKPTKRTAREVYDLTTNKANDTFLSSLADKLEALADVINLNKKLIMTEETSLLLIDYRLHCEDRAEHFGEHEEMKKAEISHRYYKVLKLAGAYAFIDESTELTSAHVYNAIALAEDSGAAFHQLLSRDKPWVKLAKYIAAVKEDVTTADLAEDLPFYRGGVSQKNEMITQAIAYGYKNNIIIKKSFADGIEFLRGETLKVTDLQKMPVSYSTDIAVDYVSEHAPFDKLYKLTQSQGLHWVSHHLMDGHRNEDNCVPGFSLVVLDVDGGVKMATVRELLKAYSYLLYTTKRHTDEDHRFRIIMPLNYELKLDAKDYKEFMANIYEWLPFQVDTATGQRARKWLSHDGHYEYNDGEQLDALPFIPKTSKNEERKKVLNTQSSMDNLERWVMNNTGDGNRNNMLLRYAMILLDAGFDFEGIRSRVVGLNDKLADKLTEMEIMSTIMISVSKAMSKKP